MKWSIEFRKNSFAHRADGNAHRADGNAHRADGKTVNRWFFDWRFLRF